MTLDIKTSSERLVSFVRNYSEQTGIQSWVVGLSGGVDSSLSAVLAAKAVGPENIMGIIMPYQSSSPLSKKDAMNVADKFGINTELIEIAPMIDTYFGNEEVTAVRRGNKCARERMSILFDIASRDNRLVLGTSNKTEISLGYSTWYGDSACSINPLAGLYKREVWAMANLVGIPDEIIQKAPTADLWPNQTDEDELGLTYEIADQILDLIVEKGIRHLSELDTCGATRDNIDLVVNRINSFSFKRSLPAMDLINRQPIPEKVVLEES